MSKVAISGDSSGTGTFTIKSPNSNSDRTLTLPDGSGALYNQSNIVGTVSESSGVPTGAIIEQGSNANGEFVKYADGTMIVYISANENRSASGNHTTTLTLPATFVDAQVGPTGEPYTAFATLLSGAPQTVTNISIATAGFSTSSLGIITVRSNSTNSAFFVQCIGRWY